MGFSIGVVEIMLVGLAAIGALICWWRNSSLWKFAAVTAIGLAIAGVLTPADPMSTLLMSMLLLACFASGVFFQASQSRLST